MTFKECDAEHHRKKQYFMIIRCDNFIRERNNQYQHQTHLKYFEKFYKRSFVGYQLLQKTPILLGASIITEIRLGEMH